MCWYRGRVWNCHFCSKFSLHLTQSTFRLSLSLLLSISSSSYFLLSPSWKTFVPFFFQPKVTRAESPTYRRLPPSSPRPRRFSFTSSSTLDMPLPSPGSAPDNFMSASVSSSTSRSCQPSLSSEGGMDQSANVPSHSALKYSLLLLRVLVIDDMLCSAADAEPCGLLHAVLKVGHSGREASSERFLTVIVQHDNHSVHQLMFVFPQQFSLVPLAFIKWSCTRNSPTVPNLLLAKTKGGAGRPSRNVVEKQASAGVLSDCHF